LASGWEGATLTGMVHAIAANPSAKMMARGIILVLILYSFWLVYFYL
jgi:hypothetical protein